MELSENGVQFLTSLSFVPKFKTELNTKNPGGLFLLLWLKYFLKDSGGFGVKQEKTCVTFVTGKTA